MYLFVVEDQKRSQMRSSFIGVPATNTQTIFSAWRVDRSDGACAEKFVFSTRENMYMPRRANIYVHMRYTYIYTYTYLGANWEWPCHRHGIVGVSR